MIVVLASSLYIGIFAWAYGAAVIAWAERDAGGAPGERLPLPVVCFVGLAVVGTLVGYGSLLLPVAGPLHAIVGVGAVAGGLYAWRVGRRSARTAAPGVGWSALVVGCLAGFIVVANASSPPQNYDTGLYHAQILRWTEDHSIVLGLGNLWDHLAFNSSWFLLEALFGFSFLGYGPVRAFNGAVALMIVLGAAQGVQQIVRGRPDLASCYRALLLIPLFLYKTDLSSDTPDLGAGLVTLAILGLLLWIGEDRARRTTQGALLALVLLAAFMPTIKPSAAPAVLVVLYPLVAARRWGWRYRALLAGVVAAVWLPWIARNALLSGYLIYPVTALGPLPVDWRIPIEITARRAAWVRSWARIQGPDPDVVLAMPFATWTSAWFRNLLIVNKGVVVAILGAVVATVAASAAGLGRARDCLRQRPLVGLALAVGYAGALFWFAAAPDFRFGFGFLWAVLLTYLAWGLSWTWPRHGRLPTAGLVAALLLFETAELATRLDWRAAASQVVWQADYPSVATRVVELPSGLRVNVPETGDQCWNAPRPCSPYADERLMLRGTELAAGFRLR